MPLLVVAELVRTDLPVIDPHETLDTVLDKFAATDAASLPLRVAERPPGPWWTVPSPVATPPPGTAGGETGLRITGLITRQAALATYNAELTRRTG